jgi:hypothetical protein
MRIYTLPSVLLHPIGIRWLSSTSNRRDPSQETGTDIGPRAEAFLSIRKIVLKGVKDPSHPCGIPRQAFYLDLRLVCKLAFTEEFGALRYRTWIPWVRWMGQGTNNKLLDTGCRLLSAVRGAAYRFSCFPVNDM